MFKILSIVMILHGHQPVPGAFQLGSFESMTACEGERLSEKTIPAIRQMFKVMAGAEHSLSFKIVKTACVPTELAA